MSRFVGPSSKKLLLLLVIVVLLFGFAPISRGLLRTVDGSFSQNSYSSLALRSPSSVTTGLVVGEPVLVQLTNRSGHLETYHWNATENGALISLGEETVGNGRSAKISVPSRGAVAGSLRIALTGTVVFLTVPLVKS
jgi:hypothetical protein